MGGPEMLLATVMQLIRLIGNITRNQIARRLSASDAAPLPGHGTPGIERNLRLLRTTRVEVPSEHRLADRYFVTCTVLICLQPIQRGARGSSSQLPL